MAQADELVFLWINGWAGRLPALDGAARLMASDYLVPVSLALTLLALWFGEVDRVVRERHQIGVIVAVSAMALSSWAVLLMNGAYFRPRPFDQLDVTLLFYKPTDSSFPANTAAASFAVAAAIWGVNRRAGLALFVAAGVFGLARIYTGVHYPLDILGGAMLGIAVAFLTTKAKDLLEPLLTMIIKAARVLCLA